MRRTSEPSDLLQLDGAFDAKGLARTINHYGDTLVSSLHGHHTWEDNYLFPDLTKREGRIQRGPDMLERVSGQIEKQAAVAGFCFICF